MTSEHLNAVLAVAALLVAAAAFIVALNTLSYMRDRDLEVDTRSGWVEIHRAMINLRVQREFILLQNAMADPHPVVSQQNIREYTLASAQLRAQLDRLNDDPVVIEVAAFMEAHQLAAQWQTLQFVAKYDEFVHQVAL